MTIWYDSTFSIWHWHCNQDLTLVMKNRHLLLSSDGRDRRTLCSMLLLMQTNLLRSSLYCPHHLAKRDSLSLVMVVHITTQNFFICIHVIYVGNNSKRTPVLLMKSACTQKHKRNRKWTSKEWNFWLQMVNSGNATV